MATCLAIAAALHGRAAAVAVLRRFAAALPGARAAPATLLRTLLAAALLVGALLTAALLIGTLPAWAPHARTTLVVASVTPMAGTLVATTAPLHAFAELVALGVEALAQPLAHHLEALLGGAQPLLHFDPRGIGPVAVEAAGALPLLGRGERDEETEDEKQSFHSRVT